MNTYPEEIKQFIAENVQGTYVNDLVEKINRTFGTSYTYNQIKSYKKNHRLKSGVPSGVKKNQSRLFTEEIGKFIANNVTGTTLKELTKRVNATFDTTYTEQQIKRYKDKNKLTSGLDMQFKKGMIPHNKDKKGAYAPGSEKGWFKKGNTPRNHKPIGSERVCSKDGYILIKVEEPRTWKLKQRVVWEEHYGTIPKDKVLIFLDGNKLNIDIKNLALVSRNELKIMNQEKLKTDNAATTETGILIAKLISKKHERKKATTATKDQ